MSTGMDFRKGAVRPVSDHQLLRHIDALAQAFPESRFHRTAFQDLGSEFVYARPIDRVQFPDFDGTWVVLVRFGLKIETLFGFTREVTLIYSPHKDLQIRSYEAITQIIDSDLPREVTSGIAFVSTPDPRQEEKLEDWSSPRLTAIPVPFDLETVDRPARKILQNLESRLFTRDLYGETAPVAGSDFFGRQILLQSLVDDIRLNRVFGIFGLRKAGKTSLLKKLGEQLSENKDRQVVFVLRDLESLPSVPSEVIRPLLLELHDSLWGELRQRGVRTKELAEIDDPGDLLQFKRGLQTLLRKVAQERVQIVIALDEIEYLCPPDQIDLVKPETQEITQFFGVLRSLVQETENFSFAVAGLASAAIESGLLFGRHNPLFSWGKVYYVPPFSYEEAETLLITLGRQMGVSWDEGAISAIYDASGGHPFLLRDLASRITTRLPLTVEQRSISKGMVHKNLGAWKRSVAGNLAEILSHVDRYYPNERWFLELLQAEDPEAQALAQEDPQALHHLVELGLVREEDGVFKASSLVREIH